MSWDELDYTARSEKNFFKLIKPIDKLICLCYNIGVPRERDTILN